MTTAAALIVALTGLVTAIAAAAKLWAQLHHERHERLERRKRLR